MNGTVPTEITALRATTLRHLHEGPGMLVMPNAWDAASARTFEAAGFPAVATTSGGVAQSLGFQDHEDAPAGEMLAAAARIAGAIAVPVTVDLEAGYRLTSSELMQRTVALGAAGCNLEDTDHHGDDALVSAEEHAERIAACRAAARALGVDIVLNSRVDVFIHPEGSREEQLAEAIRRGQLYREAGADCLYPILLRDEELLAAFVQAVGLPVNINARRNGGIALERLAAIGVRRVTYATSLFNDLQDVLKGFAAEIADSLPLEAPRKPSLLACSQLAASGSERLRAGSVRLGCRATRA